MITRRMHDRTADNAGAWQQLLQAGSSESRSRGSTIYAPGDEATDLLLLTHGRVGLFLRSPEGRSLTLRMVEPGQVFGHTALADNTYDSFAQTLGDVRFYRIPREKVVEMITNDPPLGLALVEELGRHRLLISQCLDEVAFKSVPARLASLLLDLARNHGSHDWSLPRHSHRQLAEMINAYRETVTKVINQFRAARLLEIEQSTITLLNLRRLEELAQS